MPSFDIVSKTDLHEITNAVDQTLREISTRFDLRGTDTRVEMAKNTLTLIAASDFQLKQLHDILCSKLAKRNVDIRAVEFKKADVKLNEARQEAIVKQGIETDMAKCIVKKIKEAGLKVQTAIQGEQIRVTGKKRDDLQATIAILREAKFNCSLQYENFRE